MSVHVEVGSDGGVQLPASVVKALGIKPGDIVSVGRSGSRLIVNRNDEQHAALQRLRSALGGYSVDQFLAERAGDWSE